MSYNVSKLTDEELSVQLEAEVRSVQYRMAIELIELRKVLQKQADKHSKRLNSGRYK